MRALWTVMRREVVERVRSKAFLISTIVTLVIIGGVVAAISVAAQANSGPATFHVGVVGRSTPTLNTTLQLGTGGTKLSGHDQ